MNMKTKELIRQLQEVDPSGEEEVCVHNVDIFFVEKLPAYYDGASQVLIRDESKKPYYDVVGAKYKRNGYKIKITCHSISDVLWDHPDFPIDYSELGESYKYNIADADVRRIAKDSIEELELSHFTDYRLYNEESSVHQLRNG